MESALLSRRQYFIIVVYTTTSTAFFLLPPVLISDAGQHAWLTPLWTGCIGLLCSLPWLYLAVKFPKLNLIQICIRLAGKVGGRIFGLLLVFQMILIASWVINNLHDYMTTTQLPKTNEWIFGGTFLLLAVYSTVKGIAALARTAEFITPIMAAGFLVFFLLSLHDWDWSRFTPVLEVNWDGLLRRSSFMIAFPYMDAFTLLMLFPYLPNKAGITYLKGTLLGMLLLSLITFIIIGALGVSRASHVTYPLYVLAQELKVSEFLEHMEATISVLWLTFIYVKLTLTFYCTVIAIACIFNADSRGLISLPLGVLLLGLSENMHQNTIFNIEWIKRYLLINHSFYAVLLPLVLIALYSLFRRRNS